MADMKPTVDQILKRKFAGQSMVRVQWNDAKKRAVKGGIKESELKAAFKEDLGPLLDSLNQLYQGAKEVKRYHAKLDDRTLKPVRTLTAKIEGVIRNYKQTCKTKAAAGGPTANAWSTLETAVTTVEAATTKVRTELLKG